MERLLFIIQHWWICYNTQHIVQISFMVWFTVQGVYLLQGMQSKVSAYSLIKVRSLIHCIVHLLLYCDNCNLFERIYIHVKLWLIVVMRVKFFFSGQSLNMGYVISFVCMWGLTILLMRYQRGRNEMIQVKHAQQQDFTVLLQISLGLKTDCILGSCECCDSDFCCDLWVLWLTRSVVPPLWSLISQQLLHWLPFNSVQIFVSHRW